MLPRLSSVLVLASLLAFAGGAALVAYGRWSIPMAVAADAAAHRDAALALSAYERMEARVRRWPTVGRVLAVDYESVANNRLALLYRTGQYDAVIEKAEGAPDASAPRFWAGCALFAKSGREATAEGRLLWLSRAEDEFKRALESAPDDWDAKYNYELTARLAAALRREPKSKPSPLMPLLRPQPRAARPPDKKTG